MENAADALKMAAAVLIFVLAISVAMYGFTKARQAATAVISNSDKSVYYDAENTDIVDERIVGIEAVIPAIYSYFKEGYTVLFYTANWDGKQIIGDIKPMTLYYSEALPINLSASTVQNKSDNRYAFSYEGKLLHRGIYGLDADDESTRREPWISDDVTYKNFIMSLTNRTQTPYYEFSREKYTTENQYQNGNRNSNKLAINFTYNFVNANTSLANMNTAKFMERSGIYNTDRIKSNANDEDTDTRVSIEDSTIEFDSGAVSNDQGTSKRVIQFIYLNK